MSERIRHRCEKTSRCTPVHRIDRCQDTTETIRMGSWLVFSLRGLRREFAAVGGEM